MHEFILIERHFQHWPPQRHPPVLGIGDDAALLAVPPGRELVVAADTLVAGVHFPLDTAPEDIGFKALAVNLSDLAAMGADPAWFTLCLTCPHAEESWWSGFARGLREAAELGDIALVGGDTTRGPLSISIQVMGLVPAGQAIRRDGARVGEDLWVTGRLGEAGLDLQRWPRPPFTRLTRPLPRLREGLALRGIASAMIDISDGLASDLRHLANASGVGFRVEIAALPLPRESLPPEEAWRLALTAGDDYELAFITPREQRQTVQALGEVTRIGEVTTSGIRFIRPDGATWHPGTGWSHF